MMAGVFDSRKRVESFQHESDLMKTLAFDGTDSDQGSSQVARDFAAEFLKLISGM